MEYKRLEDERTEDQNDSLEDLTVSLNEKPSNADVVVTGVTVEEDIVARENFLPDFVSLSPGTRYSLALKTSRIHRLPFPHVSNCSNQYPEELNDIVPRGATYSNQNCMMLCFGKFSSNLP